MLLSLMIHGKDSTIMLQVVIDNDTSKENISVFVTYWRNSFCYKVVY